MNTGYEFDARNLSDSPTVDEVVDALIEFRKTIPENAPGDTWPDSILVSPPQWAALAIESGTDNRVHENLALPGGLFLMGVKIQKAPFGPEIDLSECHDVTLATVVDARQEYCARSLTIPKSLRLSIDGLRHLVQNDELTVKNFFRPNIPGTTDQLWKEVLKSVLAGQFRVFGMTIRVPEVTAVKAG